MAQVASAIHGAELPGPTRATIPAAPGWLRVVDGACIMLLNLGLLFEVVAVFLNTVLRPFHATLMPGMEETARLFLIGLAFLGGGVAYGRGQFMAITVAVDRLPQDWRAYPTAAVQWVVIAVTAAIGGASIPLEIMNAGGHSTLLGISFVWMVLPMTVGSAVLILHAGVALGRMRRKPVLASGAFVAAIVLALVLAREGAWTETAALPLLVGGVFVLTIAIGVPVGFVLGAVGILYVLSTGAAPVVAIASTAQRGTGGFIFLALPFFIVTGFIMDRGGIGARIVDFLSALIGHVRGGLLQVSIVGMYIASGISGAKAADMAAVGIPMNKSFRRQGYDPAEAAAVLAASAAMGESIPPSIAILAMGSVTSISTGALFLAGLLPAATIAACLMAVVYLRALRSGRKPTTRAALSHRLATGRRAVVPLAMPVLLIGGIVAGLGTPTEVSSFAVVYGLAVGIAIYRQIGAASLWEIATEASLLSGMIFFTFSGATLFSWALSLEGVPDIVASGLGALGPHLFLPAVIVITILLGAVLESIVTIIILGPLLLPVALQLGVDPLQYSIVLIEAFGIGSIIPPVGLALYIACAICETGVDRTARPLAGYLAVLCLGLLIVAAVPWITLVLPHAFHFGS
jgi:tripartite ATP-independent transporter DctM subunit